ncbi:hypothetical protein E2542_SST28546 [Spatholobus suberectus]|nr:hypothetical protein E2542_SST28546 [Spatholobus suberectus]
MKMVVELCSENCGVSSMSPRISFSHDFSQSDVIPVEKHPLRSNSSGLNSSIDFDFCVHESLELESSSADELFSDGVILPTQIKKKINNNALLKQRSQLAPPQPQLPPSRTTCDNASSTSKGSKKEGTKDSKDLSDEVYEKQSSKSFWRFKRSSSCGSGYGRSLCLCHFCLEAIQLDLHPVLRGYHCQRRVIMLSKIPRNVLPSQGLLTPWLHTIIQSLH